MKNFDGFKTTLTSDVLESISKETLNEIELYLDENPFEDHLEGFVWTTREFSIRTTMRLLERYHNWLHGD